MRSTRRRAAGEAFPRSAGEREFHEGSGWLAAGGGPEVAAVAGDAGQVVFDTQELVVLRHPVRPARRSRLDLARVCRHRDVRDRHILGLATAVADDGRQPVALGQLNGVQRFAERADLVHLDENAVPGLLVDASLQPLDIGNEQVVANQLDLAAQLDRQLSPAVPVVLRQAILNRADRVPGAELLPQVDHLVRAGDAVWLALEETVPGLALLLSLVE